MDVPGVPGVPDKKERAADHLHFLAGIVEHTNQSSRTGLRGKYVLHTLQYHGRRRASTTHVLLIITKTSAESGGLPVTSRPSGRPKHWYATAEKEARLSYQQE